ncbi:MAG: aldehyde ferredoxin oxidoreductase C-terminal domain-containing protein, partial [Bacillota bacterium]
IHCKGLAFPAHDPRAYNSMALGYATSNRGACHLQAFSHPFERNLSMPEVGLEQPADRFAVEGKAGMVARLQDIMCLFDSLALCKFLLFGHVGPSLLLEWLNLVTGWDLKLPEMMQAGERAFNLKRMFNVACGISRKDDVLPPRISFQRRGEGGAPQNLPPMERVLADYSEVRGWSDEGIPTAAKLQELGIAGLVAGVNV